MPASDPSATSTKPATNTLRAPSNTPRRPAIGAHTAVVMYMAEMIHDTPADDPNWAAMPTIATAIIDEFKGWRTVPDAAAKRTRTGIAPRCAPEDTDAVTLRPAVDRRRCIQTRSQ
ncbi:hypothetical protein rerp_08050 [Rhodococcus erythropolis]|nr:hypothetical protein rerp_08050 [Rhodococcus erythropolis]